MKLLKYILFVFLISGCSSVSFKPVALYDSFATHPEEERSDKIIFDESEGTMWNSMENCGDFEVTSEVAHSGNSSIKISWNKASCEWIGFGNSFNNWAAVDLSKERFNNALSFYVRTQEGVNSAIPLVACLEDFSGGGSYYFVDAGKYLCGLELDSTWKQVIVPLWHFPVFEDEVDIKSIKQMQFQLEGAGSFYLDDMKIIEYSTEMYDAMRAEVELFKPTGEPNQQVYTEGELSADAWGHENNRCQTLAEVSDNKSGKCIEWEFDSAECAWAKWGINWNDWYAMNLRGITESSSILMDVKADSQVSFKVFLEDFKGHNTEVLVYNAKSEDFGKWSQFSISLSDLNLKEKGFVLDQIRQIRFEGVNKGKVQIDNIKLESK